MMFLDKSTSSSNIYTVHIIIYLSNLPRTTATTTVSGLMTNQRIDQLEDNFEDKIVYKVSSRLDKRMNVEMNKVKWDFEEKKST